MLAQKENRIGEIVAENFRTAKIFEENGLDFCCGGKKTIIEACREKGVNPELLISQLNKIDDSGSRSTHFNSWEVDFLIEYIIINHHSYVVNSIPTIEHHLQEVIAAHGMKFPSLTKIEELFADLKDELTAHMAKEEKMLFPYIKKMYIAFNNSLDMPAAPFGTVGNPVKVMESEHEAAGNLVQEISRLTNNYTPPEGACGKFKVLYAELKEFESDLHVHIHLENNILFPKAQELEEKLNKKHSDL
jgi:regulator of cell morphogenesis and NO signaling